MLRTAVPEVAPNANPYCAGFVDATLTVTEYELPWPTAVQVSPEPVATCADADEATEAVKAANPMSVPHNRITLMMFPPSSGNSRIEPFYPVPSLSTPRGANVNGRPVPSGLIDFFTGALEGEACLTDA
jgi:hypothetical protein